MTRFFLILFAATALFSSACHTPRKFPPRPTMPIMQLQVKIGPSSLVYTHVLEVQPDEFPANLAGFRMEIISEDEVECVASRFGSCSLDLVNTDEVLVVAYCITASRERVSICDPSALTFEFVHRSSVEGSDHLFPRVLPKDVAVKRIGGQCVFALVDLPQPLRSLR